MNPIGMKATIQTLGWIAFGIDAVGLLAILGWALSASSRDGEIAYALVFLLLTGIWLAVGGTGLAISGQRGSAMGIWSFTFFLALPPVIGLALRIANSL
jgi:hypothetical protein